MSVEYYMSDAVRWAEVAREWGDVVRQGGVVDLRAPPVREESLRRMCLRLNVGNVKHVVKTKESDCDVCYLGKTQFGKTECGHYMCADCFKDYLGSTPDPVCHMCRSSLK